jgi:hypothetical protein
MMTLLGNKYFDLKDIYGEVLTHTGIYHHSDGSIGISFGVYSPIRCDLRMSCESARVLVAAISGLLDAPAIVPAPVEAQVV